MEMNMKIPLLFLLLLMLSASTRTWARCPECPSQQHERLTCYNDYNRIINCTWNSTDQSNISDAECSLYAERSLLNSYGYSASCKLEPVGSDKPGIRTCTLIFERDTEGRPVRFATRHALSINLSCVKPVMEIHYKPVCHVKTSPLGKPHINGTTVSWFVENDEKLGAFDSQLQWKRADQSWGDPSVPLQPKLCQGKCEAELELVQGEKYEARVRRKASSACIQSTWSDWGPTESWVSEVGLKPSPAPTLTTPPLQDVASAVGIIIAAVFVVLFIIKILRNDKATWVDIVKNLKGQHLPDPAKSSLGNVNFHSWVSPHFNNKSSISSSKQEEIGHMEVISTVDVVTFCYNKAALPLKIRSESSREATKSGFSNPSYSQLCPPTPPRSSHITGRPESCAANSPNESVGRDGKGKTAEQIREEESRKRIEIQQLLSMGTDNSEPVQVVSDYEKVEKLQVESSRLHGLDSGMCSSEEVSQEGLEADSINAINEGSSGKEEGEGGKEIDFQKLFGSKSSFVCKSSIQVCFDYERVNNLQPGSPELPSLDSGVSSGGEEQVSQEESLEGANIFTESTKFLFPPPTSSLPFLQQLPLKISGTCLSPGLGPLSPSLDSNALMSLSMSLEPSTGGYMPVSQEES